MKKFPLYTISFLLTAASAFCRPEVFSNRNPVTGETSTAIRGNFVKYTGGLQTSGGLAFFAEIQVDAAKLSASDGKPVYLLMVIFAGSKWLFAHGPLIANIDGKVVRFAESPIGPSRNVEGSYVSENVPFSVTRDELGQIASASKVMIQFGGSGGVFFLNLSPQNIAIFREFLAKTR